MTAGNTRCGETVVVTLGRFALDLGITALKAWPFQHFIHFIISVERGTEIGWVKTKKRLAPQSDQTKPNQARRIERG